MISEQALARNVIKLLRSLDAVRVENPAYPGTPDVNFVEGWIELKVAQRWPVQEGILRLDHFTTQQRVWLRRRWELGGRVLLLLQVSREWLLFDGLTAAEVVGKAPKNELLARARNHWSAIPDREEFKKCVLAISPVLRSCG